MPFLRRHADLGQIVLGLRLQLGGLPEVAARRLAAALLLQGDTSAALAELDACTASIAARTDAAADGFRAFDRAFRDHVTGHVSDLP